MPSTINTLPANDAVTFDWTSGGYGWGQSFYLPDQSNTLLDKIDFVANSTSTTQSVSYTLRLFETSADVPPSDNSVALLTYTSSISVPHGSGTTFTADFTDINLDASKKYFFTLSNNSSTPTVRIGLRTPATYTATSSNGGAAYFLSGQWFPQSFSYNLGFQAYFNPSTAALVQIPLGYFSESSNTGYGLSGNIQSSAGTLTVEGGATATKGGAILAPGKYGTFSLWQGTQFYTYTPDQTKIAPLKAGETVTDTFGLLLTASNGTTATGTYTVTIEGDGSDPTPTKSILITGDRGTVNGKPGITIDGVTTGLDDGTKVIPWIRFPGQTSFTESSARPVVTDGEFSWSRKTGKRTSVYFTTEDQSIKSGRVTVPAALMPASSFESDPITNGARYEKDSVAVSDIAVSNVISIGGTGKKNGSNRSKTSDQLMAAGRRGLVADSNATVFSPTSNALGYSSDSTADYASADLIPVTSMSFGKVETLV